MVSGALPTQEDLLGIITKAWNWNRTIPFTNAVIHPLGVTYFGVTEALLRAGMGPAVGGVTHFPSETRHGLNDLEDQIRRLVRRQVEKNGIENFGTGTPNLAALAIEYFAPEDFGRVDAWITAPGARLGADEAAAISRRRNAR